MGLAISGGDDALPWIMSWECEACVWNLSSEPVPTSVAGLRRHWRQLETGDTRQISLGTPGFPCKDEGDNGV